MRTCYGCNHLDAKLIKRWHERFEVTDNVADMLRKCRFSEDEAIVQNIRQIFQRCVTLSIRKESLEHQMSCVYSGGRYINEHLLRIGISNRHSPKYQWCTCWTLLRNGVLKNVTIFAMYLNKDIYTAQNN